MSESVMWTPEAWASALAALRSQSSVGELLALYEGGAVTSLEVLNTVYEYCNDKPAIGAELVRVFQNYPDEYFRRIVGDGLAEALRATSTQEKGTS